MATIEIERKHSLGKDEARKRADTLLERLKASYGVKGTWAGDVFKIESPAKGECKVSGDLVRIEIDLPFMMRPLKGKIESKVNAELDTLVK